MADNDRSVQGDRRRKDNAVDQRHQQIDPAGKGREDPGEAGPKRSQKQPGQDPAPPQDET